MRVAAIASWFVNVVTPANASHFVTPADAGVQNVFLVSGFHRNDERGRIFFLYSHKSRIKHAGHSGLRALHT